MRMKTLPVQGNQGQSTERKSLVTATCFLGADVLALPTTRGGASACPGRPDSLCSRDRGPSRVTQWIPRCVVSTVSTRPSITEKETEHVR